MRRRDFVTATALAGTAGLLGVRPNRAHAEPPPEISTLVLPKTGTMCQAPLFQARDLLLSEGFSKVRYVEMTDEALARAFETGEIPFGMQYSAPLITRIDAGAPIVFLSGVHPGCLELLVTDRIRSIRDLKGKRVAATPPGSSVYIFLASIFTHVGLDPRRDIIWTYPAFEEWEPLLAAGKVDAVLHFPPYTFEMREKKIGRVLLNMATDRPWSQYFCCMVVANRDFVARHPIATKRAMRALLKAADLCALEPATVARSIVDVGLAPRREVAIQLLKELPYRSWREFQPEDTIRFYSLRLHEAGLIRSSPQKIIAEGTDWRFLKELKRELKG